MAAFRSAVAVLACLLLQLVLGPSPAFADGKVFARATAIVEIPDQEALIHHANGVETLVIETRFSPIEQPSSGDAPPYAWVVPVPGPRSDAGKGSVPEVFAVTTGTFPTLRAACAPRVEHNVPEHWFPLTALCVMLLIIMLISASHGTHAAVKFFAIVLAVMFVAAIMLPSLGKARSSARGLGDSDVEVHSRAIVGSFDVAVVGASSAAASDDLLAWLAAEGFHVPAEARAVAADYAKLGWVFVAAKLRAHGDRAGGALTPHPLGIRFRSREAVYPMRLTAVGDRPLGLDLYVFADKQAVVRGMSAVRCAAVEVDAMRSNQDRRARVRSGDQAVTIAHQQLRELAGSSPIVTKLSAKLSPPQMQEDMKIEWAEPAFTGGMKYSTQGASTLAVNWIAGLWVLSIAVVAVLAAFRKWPDRLMAPRALAALAPCLIIGLCVRLVLPTTAVTTDRRYFRNDAQQLLSLVTMQLKGPDVANKDLEQVRELFATRVFEEHAGDKYLRRVLPSLPKQEDSPHNYVIRPGDKPGQFDVVFFDDRGREVLLDVIGG